MNKLANKSRAKTMRYLARKRRSNVVSKDVSDKPRLVVNRTNKHISVQLISREGLVLAVSNDIGITVGTKSEKAFKVGEMVAEVAKAQNINTIHFDRNGYLYHGRVKQLAEGARAGGLVF